MLKTQIDNYDMFLAVENLLDDNAPVWSGNFPIAETKVLLSQTIDTLAKQVGIQLENPTGITVDKDRVRTALEEEAFVISAAASGFATVSDNGTMYKRTHYTKSNLIRFRDAELQSVCINLAKDCKDVLDALVPYGITDSVLSRFKEIIDKFADVMKNPTEAIGKRKTATEKIPVIIVQIADLLNKRMDNLMVSLRAAAPDFVERYKNVRAINSTGSRALSLTITTINAATREPIAHVELELIGQGIKRVSSKRGYNTVANLVAGNHEIKAVHPNYKPKTVAFTVVSGETTELLLELEAL
jgi:hypothetical protein